MPKKRNPSAEATSIKIDKELRNLLGMIAAARGVDVQDVVAEAIRAYVREELPKTFADAAKKLPRD